MRSINRRHAVIAAAVIPATACGNAPQRPDTEAQMFGLIGKLVARPGEREALVSALLGGSEGMPGCLSYIVARDAKEPDAIWVTEVWVSEQHHRASLALPSVQEAIARGKPLIASFGTFTSTVPVGGVGLAGHKPAVPS